jgi:hypothetical protein
MKKYVMLLSVMALVACHDAKKTEDQVRENASRENDVRQRTIDSMAAVNRVANQPEINSSAEHHHHHHSISTNNSTPLPANNGAARDYSNTAPPKKKGMSNRTKDALIGTGVGIVGGAVTGAAVSKDKGRGAVVGGIIGGAAGSAAGYGIGARKDRRDTAR